MQRTGIANLPLHPGRAPRWLFTRMVKLGRAISEVLIIEYGRDEFLRRLADPFWFQAFSCVLGFDWHSSGTTTVTCGALKEAINLSEYGIAVAGGKGSVSRRTPDEIRRFGDILSLSDSKIESMVYASRMTAKVDNSAIQDGYNLYHHVFIFSEDGKWVVIQQGMNEENRYARRYHWLSDDVKSFVEEPHSGIAGYEKREKVLNMVAKESEDCRKTCVDIVRENPRKMLNSIKNATSYQETLDKEKILFMPVSINWSLMKKIYDFQPRNYEELLSIRGVGPKTVRALALISDLIYGSEPSWKDPIKFTFTVGGKDGVPYPVDRKVMDETTDVLRMCIEEAKIGKDDKIKALHRLKDILPR
ncbi:MAG: DUF763 domain-containing protein [Thermoplasmata archaeon]|nr:MAG: DUF763 domain-containing protein [Thermoplasmata archaeon]